MKDFTHPGRGDELGAIKSSETKSEGRTDESHAEEKKNELGSYGKHGMKAHLGHAMAYFDKQEHKDCL